MADFKFSGIKPNDLVKAARYAEDFAAHYPDRTGIYHGVGYGFDYYVYRTKAGTIVCRYTKNKTVNEELQPAANPLYAGGTDRKGPAK